MKRILLITFFIFTVISLCSCKELTKEEEFNNIQKTFSGINNYISQAEIEVRGNKSWETFKVSHTFEKPDKYVTEILEPKENIGNKTTYDGSRAYLYNKQANQYKVLKQVKASEEKMLFLGHFLSNLSSVGDLNISRETIDKVDYIVIGIDIPGNNRYRVYEKLWIDKSTHLPYKLIIYDDKDKETVRVKYKDVKYNVDIKSDTFKIN